MSLASVVHGLCSTLQHPLPQPIRGRPTHLDPCRLHRFAPRVPPRAWRVPPAFLRQHDQLLAWRSPSSRRGMHHAALGMQHPRWNKARGSRCWRVPPAAQRPHSGERSAGVLADLTELRSTTGLWRLLALAKAWAIRRRSAARCAESHRKPRDTAQGTCGGVMPPRLSAKEGGVWRTPQTLPSSLKRLRKRPINSAAAPARPPRRAPAAKSPHRCPSQSTGTSRSGSLADRSDSWPARRWLEDIA